MESVIVEWISSLEVESQDVVHFVQRLNKVPEDAVCEVGNIYSRWWRTIGQRQNKRRIRNEVHLTCEPRVAEFLCKKFGIQTKYVTGSEVILIRCKREHPGTKPLGKMSEVIQAVNTSEVNDEAENSHVESNLAQASALPIEKVIALIDLLGDQVVDAQEAYELFADADARAPQRMTMIGLTKALGKLCKNGWTAKPSRSSSSHKTTECVKISVESVRDLLSKLIASDNVAVWRIPSAPTVPFLSYTDFLSCYVAFLADMHSSA